MCRGRRRPKGQDQVRISDDSGIADKRGLFPILVKVRGKDPHRQTEQGGDLGRQGIDPLCAAADDFAGVGGQIAQDLPHSLSVGLPAADHGYLQADHPHQNKHLFVFQYSIFQRRFNSFL